jgi:hypothetical protein
MHGSSVSHGQVPGGSQSAGVSNSAGRAAPYNAAQQLYALQLATDGDNNLHEYACLGGETRAAAKPLSNWL